MISLLRQLPRLGLEGLLALTLFLGLVVTVVTHTPRLLGHLGEGLPAAALAVHVLGFGAAWWVARRPQPLPAFPFLVGYAVVFAGAIGSYLLLVRPELQQDFADMWRFAREFAAADSLPTPEGYEAQRALPVLTPLVAVFGASPWVYKAANVILLLGASLFHYDVLRRGFGRGVGQAFLVLFGLAPELYFAAAVTSHDISGLFFLSAGFWGVARLYEGVAAGGWARLVLLSVALGGVLVILQVQRGVATFFLLAVGAVLIAELWPSFTSRRSLARVALLLVLPWLVLTATHTALTERGVLLPAAFTEGFVAKSFANFAGSFSPGTFSSHVEFRELFLDPLSHEEVVDLGRNAFLSDIYYDAPTYRPGNYVLRAQRLFALGSQGHHYYEDLAEDSPLSANAVVDRFGAINEVVVWLFAVLGLVGLLVTVFVLRLDGIAMLPVVFLGGLAAGLLLVGENQPRYLFAIWLIVPGHLAIAAGRLRSPRDLGVGWPTIFGRFAVGPLLLLAVAGVLWTGVRASFDVSDGRIIGDWGKVESSFAIPREELAEQFATWQEPETKLAGRRAFGSLMTTLELPRLPAAGDYFEASRVVCALDPERRSIGFFVYSQEWIPEFEGQFVFSVRAREKEVYRLGLAPKQILASVRLTELFRDDLCVELGFRVTATRPARSQGWRRASTAHVYFPRLVP